MGNVRNNLLDYAVYFVARAVCAFVQAVPWEIKYDVATRLGDLLYHVDRKHRRRAEAHLRISFPHWPDSEICRVARESMRNVIYLGLEAMYTPSMITRFNWRERIRLADGVLPEALRLLTERRGAVLMVTGHFGNFEVLGYALATLGLPLTAIARRLDNPYLNRYVLSLRERNGMRILDKQGAAESLDDLLADKQVVGFIADQDAGRKGVFVDFFGREASTFKTIALMAIRHHAPVLVGYAQRLGRRFSFEIGVERIIRPSDWADRDDPVRWITAAYTSALEQVISRDPSQYFWMHRRWKHRPRGQAKPADGIA